MPARSMTVILIMIFLPPAYAGLDAKNGTIKGAVYDLNGAIIVNIPISVENVTTGESKIIKVDPSIGTYQVSVPSGRYRSRLIQAAGYPVGEDRASFEVLPGKDIVINFRPSPVAIISVLENGKYISKYDGDFPSAMTHYVALASNGLAVKDIRVWFKNMTISGSNNFRYDTATASYENFMISAATVTYDSSNRQLIAEGRVVLDDGVRTYSFKKVTLDLIKSALISETKP